MGTLHFSLGKNFGAVLLQISRDHLHQFDYKKAFACFTDSGAPSEYWLSLLEGSKVITVDDNGVDCYIKDRKNLSNNELKEYPDLLTKDFLDDYVNEHLVNMCEAYKGIRYNYSNICNYDLTLTPKDIEYLFDVDIKNISKYHFRAYITLTIKEVMDLWNENETKFIDFMIDRESEDNVSRTYNDRLSDTFNDLAYLKRSLDKSTKFIETTLWLCEQFGWKMDWKFTDFVNITRALAYIFRMTREKSYDDLKIFFEKDFLAKQANLVVDNSVLSKTTSDNIVITKDKVQEIIDSIESKENHLSPVNITTSYYDAGFISPDGLCYGERGSTSELIHIRMADILWEQYNLDKTSKTKYYFGKDFAMMRLGWIKFHHMDIYYDSNYYGNINFEFRIPSKKVLEIIDNYALKHYKGFLSINNKSVNMNDCLLEDMTREQLEKIFDY